MSDALASRVCVLGMHRSGTSLLSEMLLRAGLELGPAWEMLGAGPSNPRGHFENRRFTWINDRVLAAFDGSWDHPPALPADWLRDPRLDETRRDARRLLASVPPERPYGWKDPRNSLVVPFWRELVPRLQFIIVLRAPLAVARSLERRDAFPLDRSSRLWFEYVRRAVMDTSGARRLFVDYDEVLRDVRGTSERLAAFCGLAPVAGDVLEESADRSLHHHESDDASVVREGAIVPEAKLLHLALARLVPKSAVELSEDVNRAVAAAVTAIDALCKTSELEAIRDRVGELELAIEAKQCESRNLEQLLAARDEVVRSLEDQMRTLQGMAVEAVERERIAREELARLEESRTGRALRALWRWKDRILPSGSWRRRAWNALWRRLPGATGP